jgi:hypothetical protein
VKAAVFYSSLAVVGILQTGVGFMLWTFLVHGSAVSACGSRRRGNAVRRVTEPPWQEGSKSPSPRYRRCQDWRGRHRGKGHSVSAHGGDHLLKNSRGTAAAIASYPASLGCKWSLESYSGKSFEGVSGSRTAASKSITPS